MIDRVRAALEASPGLTDEVGRLLDEAEARMQSEPGPGVVFLTGLEALYPYLRPLSLLAQLEGRNPGILTIAVVLATVDGDAISFMGVEPAERVLRFPLVVGLGSPRES